MILTVSELRAELDDLTDQEKLSEDDEERFQFLTELFDAIGPDAPDSLVPEEDFGDHVRREAEDDVPARWLPYIDWESYERDARSDYTEIEVDGETYLYIA